MVTRSNTVFRDHRSSKQNFGAGTLFYTVKSKRPFLTRKEVCFARRWVPKSLLEICHHLLHFLSGEWCVMCPHMQLGASGINNNLFNFWYTCKQADNSQVKVFVLSQNYGKQLLASSCLSVCPHRTAWLPLDGYWWNLIFRFLKNLTRKFKLY